ncbi:MAG: N-6 DNA methylase [Sedimentisphaerales bacterium]|nr:N-6 DNA methylase [Sedimentisphaerales bacterium]
MATDLTPKEIFPYLRQCGYGSSLLCRDYVYSFAGSVKPKIAAVGFAREHYESSNACIAVMDGGKIEENKIAENVQIHRGLGAPAILVCHKNKLLFWYFQDKKAVQKESIGFQKLDAFFAKHREDFEPDSILRAKKMGRMDKKYQLGFVDLGLMPLIEEEEGYYLSGLIERIIRQLSDKRATLDKWHFQTAFWMIGAKILQDKGVQSFRRMDIENIDSLIEKIHRHYNAQSQLKIPQVEKKNVQKVAREIVKPVSSFSHMSINSLAYVYENTLVTKATRKAFGTHATPPWLVNFIVWQLADWIEEIPQDERFILEPTCGHAPFLTAGAKLLSFLYKGREENRHDYLKNHLMGIELDSFAAEIARLSLTLADLPNRDGWQIINHDIYSGDTLKQAARNSTILLCNPPFENAKKNERNYSNILTKNKAAEILAQTLPYMPANSVFGVILPQGFLHKKNLADLRKYILDNCEIRTICNLPENVFDQAGHLSTVLLGRKKKSRKRINYITVPRNNLSNFIERYQATEETVAKETLYKAPCYSFRIPELKQVWEYCKAYGRFSDVANIGKGLEYKGKGKGLPPNSITVSPEPFKGGIKGFCSYSKNIKITELPDEVYMNLSPEVIGRPRWGTARGTPQILLNYNRVSSGPWRLKAWLDSEGHPVTSNFLVIRPIEDTLWTLNSLWAMSNSPFANAFAYCNSLERNNTTGTMRSMPVPRATNHDIAKLNELTSDYFVLSEQQEQFMSGDEGDLKEKMKRCLMKIDAEVMRLYDLPPRLERQLLDFFAGQQRKGVDFKFEEYFPENIGSYIPLWMFISDEFQNSTVENVSKWVEETRSPQVTKALDKAVKAFEGD